MSTNINTYSTLTNYAVLAQTGLTSTNPTTITNGSFGSVTGAIPSVTFIGTNDDAGAGVAQSELSTLITNINAAANALTTTFTTLNTAQAITLYSNINYDITASLSFINNITLDAQGDVNAQFFIRSPSFTFNNSLSMILLNGASNNNIFWLATTGNIAINGGFSSTTKYGLFIATLGTITVTGASNFSGRLYADAANISFIGAASAVNANLVVSTVPPIDINNVAYGTLNTYAVLAQNGLTSVGSTTIQEGVVPGIYGTVSGGATGSFVGTQDNANAPTAQAELTTLNNVINLATTTPNTPTPIGSSITLIPNILDEYYDVTTFTGVSIILDAQGNPNAQFFIKSSGSLTFNNVPSITLINGASSDNIFWIAMTNIQFTGTLPPTIPGIFIANTGSITLSSASNIFGHLYSENSTITFTGNSFVYPIVISAPFVYLNDPAYSTLNTYAVLAQTGLTSNGKTTITNGYYGTPGLTGITGSFIGTSDGNNANTAQVNLTTFILGLVQFGSSIPDNLQSTILLGNFTMFPYVYYYSSSALLFDGPDIILDAQGNPNAQFFIVSNTSMTFNNVPSIQLINGASSCNIFWIANTIIEFTGTMPQTIPGTFIAINSITFSGASNFFGRLYSDNANISFIGNSSVTATCPFSQVICYLKGTLILTEKGFVPIENIKTGNHIITKGKIHKNKYINENASLTAEPVYWASKFKVIDLNSKSRPICIKKDALGTNYPFKDLFVSPNHSLLLNGKMVLAKNLVNNTTIYQDYTLDENIEYYHLECESHSAIIANGILSESYFGGNNRDIFENSISLRRRRFDLNQIYNPLQEDRFVKNTIDIVDNSMSPRRHSVYFKKNYASR